MASNIVLHNKDMTRLLTIAIPTFNRSVILDKQLECLNQAILPRVYIKLREIGYSKKFSQQLIIDHFTKENTLRRLIGGIKRFPIMGLKTAIPYLILAIKTFAESILSLFISLFSPRSPRLGG